MEVIEKQYFNDKKVSHLIFETVKISLMPMVASSGCRLTAELNSSYQNYENFKNY